MGPASTTLLPDQRTKTNGGMRKVWTRGKLGNFIPKKIGSEQKINVSNKLISLEAEVRHTAYKYKPYVIFTAK